MRWMSLPLFLEHIKVITIRGGKGGEGGKRRRGGKGEEGGRRRRGGTGRVGREEGGGGE